MAGLQIGFGGLCVDNDGTCTASTTGQIASVSSYTGNSDLAEMYFSSTALEAGEVVNLIGELSIDRASEASTLPILGVVSTKPGVVMGADDTSTRAGEEAYPIALAGRVPVQLSTENGPIAAGDELMLSSLPGVAMKATGTGITIGIALEDFNDTRYYSTTYLNQFGDDLVDPQNEPIATNDDPRINDGCYYSGGNATGEEPCVPLSATTTNAQLDEANNRAADESVAQQLAELARERSERATLATGETVRVGQVVMFVERSTRWLDNAQYAALATLLSTSTDFTLPEQPTMLDRLVQLAQGFVDGVLTLTGIRTDELCVGDVCVTEAEFAEVFQNTNTANVNATNANESSQSEDSADSTDNGETSEPVTDSTDSPEPVIDISTSTPTTTPTSTPTAEQVTEDETASSNDTSSTTEAVVEEASASTTDTSGTTTSTSSESTETVTDETITNPDSSNVPVDEEVEENSLNESDTTTDVSVQEEEVTPTEETATTDSNTTDDESESSSTIEPVTNDTL
jgi:hypothetical protein